jgi:CRISPR-associated protein Csm2
MNGNQNYQKSTGNKGWTPPPPPEWERKFNPEWITKAITKDCIEYCKDFGTYLFKPGELSTSQIRMVYGELKRIQMKGFDKEQTSFLLLRPKMAYADKRNEKGGLKELKKVFDKAYQYVEQTTHFDNFMNFMEATLAYHKAAGGR